MRPFLLAAVALLTAPGALAQQRTIDEGSFTLYVNNQRVGREQFSIRQTSAGGTREIVASATISRGDERLEPLLKADGSGRPLAYELTVLTGGRRVPKVQAMARAGRFSGRIVGTGGRATERDLPLVSGTIVLDDDVVHHFYFVAQSTDAVVPIVIPQRLVRDSVRVTRRGDGDVEVGNGTIPSRHLTVTASGGVVTDVWVDAAGRVLRVHVASRGFTAVRDEAPR